MDRGKGRRRLFWTCSSRADTTESSDFGRLIKELRVNAGMSQRELGERIGTTQSAIARLETGGVEPKICTLQKLAKALDCDLHLYVMAQEST